MPLSQIEFGVALAAIGSQYQKQTRAGTSAKKTPSRARKTIQTFK